MPRATANSTCPKRLTSHHPAAPNAQPSVSLWQERELATGASLSPPRHIPPPPPCLPTASAVAINPLASPFGSGMTEEEELEEALRDMEASLTTRPATADVPQPSSPQLNDRLEGPQAGAQDAAEHRPGTGAKWAVRTPPPLPSRAAPPRTAPAIGFTCSALWVESQAHGSSGSFVLP